MPDNKRIRIMSRSSETYFRLFCNDADITVSRPEHDEHGWDAFIEFPPNSVTCLHRDAQPSPLKCFVQVKSTDNPAGSAILMSISNWEHLAKSIIPAFLCIMYYEGNRKPQKVYLTHFDATHIYRALQRVRDLEAKNQLSKINNKRMPFTPLLGDLLIDPEHADLKSIIQDKIGLDFGKYTRDKDDLLKRIGFGKEVFSFAFTSGSPAVDTIDAFLGLKPLTVKDIVISSTRFGIKLIDTQIAEGILEIQPAAVAKCKITAESSLRNQSVVVDADIVIAELPSLSENLKKTLIKYGDTRFEISAAEGNFYAKLSGDKLYTLKELEQQTRFLATVESPDSKITLFVGDQQTSFDLEEGRPANRYFLSIFQSCNNLRKALATAGIDDINLFVRNLFDQEYSMKWFTCIVSASELSMTSKLLAKALPEQGSVNGYYGSAVWGTFGEKTLALLCLWEAEASKDGDDIRICIDNCFVFDHAWILDAEVDLVSPWKAFRGFAKAKAGDRLLVMFGPPDKIEKKASDVKLILN